MLLLRDRAGPGVRHLAYPAPGWSDLDYGRTFPRLGRAGGRASRARGRREAYDPEPPEFAGTRCQSVVAGGEQFLAAADRNRRVGAGRPHGARRGPRGAGGAAPARGPLRGPRGHALGRGSRLAAQLRLARGARVRRVPGGRGGVLHRRLALGARALRSPAHGQGSVGARDRALHGRAQRSSARPPRWRSTSGATSMPGRPTRRGAERRRPRVRGLSRGLSARALRHVGRPGCVRRAQWLGGGCAPRKARLMRGCSRARDPTRPRRPRCSTRSTTSSCCATAPARRSRGRGCSRSTTCCGCGTIPTRPRRGVEEYTRYGLPLLTAEELAAQEAAFAGHAELYRFLEGQPRVLHRARLPRGVAPAARRCAPAGLRAAAVQPPGAARNGAGRAGRPQRGGLLAGAARRGDRDVPAADRSSSASRSTGSAPGRWRKSSRPARRSRTAQIREILIENSRRARGAAGRGRRPRPGRRTSATARLMCCCTRSWRARPMRPRRATSRWCGRRAGSKAIRTTTDQPQAPLGLFVRGTFADGYACPDLRETVAPAGARSARHQRAAVPRRFLPPQRVRRYVPRHSRRPKASSAAIAAYPGTPTPRSKFYDEIDRRSRRVARGQGLCAVPRGPLLRALGLQQLRRRAGARGAAAVRGSGG